MKTLDLGENLGNSNHVNMNQNFDRLAYRVDAPSNPIDTVLSNLNSLSLSEETSPPQSCTTQARNTEDVSATELAAYLEDYLHVPKEMSEMAEMMYT